MSEVTKMNHDPAPVVRPADQMVAMIKRMMMDPSADIEKLERMLAMKERLDAQSALVSFSTAVAAARAEIPPIVKDATVDFTTAKGKTHYRHETLAGIAKVIDPILSAHGLSYRFRTDQEGGNVAVTCIVSHEAGHSEETTLKGAPDQSGNKNGFQAVGSAVTYLQRYTLKAALGLSAAADDDGQSAAPRPEDRHPTVSAEQFTKLRDMAEAAGISEAEVCRQSRIGAPSFDQFPAAEYEAALGWLKRRTEARKPRDGEIIGDEIPY